MLLPVGICVVSGEYSAWPRSDESAPSLSIAHVAIRVANLSASRTFYSSLGYQEAFSLDTDGAPTEAFFKVNDRQFIELYPSRKPDQEIGFLHVCFGATDLAAVNQLYTERGLSPTPVKRAGAGNLLFTMVGPEKQNIEFTQYMPGSRHTLDIGKHLGPNRIADSIVGIGIPMSDVAAADTFYRDSMQFAPLPRGREAGANGFRIPGKSDGELDILPEAPHAHFHLMLGFANLQRAEQQLKSRYIEVHREGHTLVIHDPDGNIVVLVPAPEGNGAHS
jgi:catechol 2,3-dioxygenase-like lactoylglutathione lyase family enzyme